MSKVRFVMFESEFRKRLQIPEAQDLSMNLGELSQFDSLGRLQAIILIEDLFDTSVAEEFLSPDETLEDLFIRCESLASSDGT